PALDAREGTGRHPEPFLFLARNVNMAISDIGQLRASVRGAIIQPGDADYDEARKVFNGMIDKRPGLIVRCVGTADVVAAVRHACETDNTVVGRRRGRGVAGYAMCDDGLVIDLSTMTRVRVDPAART